MQSAVAYTSSSLSNVRTCGFLTYLWSSSRPVRSAISQVSETGSSYIRVAHAFLISGSKKCVSSLNGLTLTSICSTVASFGGLHANLALRIYFRLSQLVHLLLQPPGVSM